MKREAASDDIATRLLGVPFAALDPAGRTVTQHVALRKPIARNLGQAARTPSTRGQRAADAVAHFGGSWAFVIRFALVMLTWVALNGVLLCAHGHSFDPYPYILLNLFLSMLAAIQAPVILMSQNRQSERDRLSAEHGYAMNLEAELEIMLLHEKIDTLRDQQWQDLLQLLLRYTQALITQMARTAVCNRHHNLDQQLCRWLLLSLDRLHSNELVMTQELIANMLGVRREGVTEAAGRLQDAGLIAYRRGHITVLDRPGLEQRTCECHDVVKKEYERLLPERMAT